MNRKRRYIREEIREIIGPDFDVFLYKNVVQ